MLITVCSVRYRDKRIFEGVGFTIFHHEVRPPLLPLASYQGPGQELSTLYERRAVQRQVRVAAHDKIKGGYSRSLASATARKSSGGSGRGSRLQSALIESAKTRNVVPAQSIVY